jgi:hypothetical protein
MTLLLRPFVILQGTKMSTPTDKPARKRRIPLGNPLTVEQLTRLVGTGETPSDAMEAQALWEQRAPTYARAWLKARAK